MSLRRLPYHRNISPPPPPPRACLNRWMVPFMLMNRKRSYGSKGGGGAGVQGGGWGADGATASFFPVRFLKIVLRKSSLSLTSNDLLLEYCKRKWIFHQGWESFCTHKGVIMRFSAHSEFVVFSFFWLLLFPIPYNPLCLLSKCWEVCIFSRAYHKFIEDLRSKQSELWGPGK